MNFSQKCNAFLGARKTADKKLRRRPNILGTYFGTKVVDGVETPCYTVMVSIKKKPSELEDNEMIPPMLTRNGKFLLTDVIQVGRPRLESGFRIFDGTQVGTVGAFLRHSDQFYALTCAHCITGPDGNVATSDPVAIDYPTPNTGAYDLGMTGQFIESRGTGRLPDFSDVDAGLIEISSELISNYAENRQNLEIYRPPLSPSEIDKELINVPVQGWGGTANGYIYGQVLGTMVHLLMNDEIHYFDLCIGNPPLVELTHPGDSGLLWRLSDGRALAVHMAGDGYHPNYSKLSYGYFASRLIKHFESNEFLEA